MSATLSYELKSIFHHLALDARWNVLSVFILHANIRNRCWPKTDTITAMATNGNRNIAIRAKKWLIEHKAIELVPHDKRVNEEIKLHQSRHVYQLTGTIDITDENGKTTTYPYLHGNSATPALLDSNSAAESSVADKSLADKSLSPAPHNNNQEKQTTTNKQTKTNKQQQQPSVGVGDLILCLPEAVDRVFASQPALARKLMAEHDEIAVTGWCAYAAAQQNLKNPVGLVRAKLKSGETPPLPAPKPEPTIRINDAIQSLPASSPSSPLATTWQKYQSQYSHEVDKKSEALWAVAKSQLELINSELSIQFRSWRLLRIEDDTFVVFVPAIDINQRYTKALAEQLTRLRGTPTTIRLVDKRPMTALEFEYKYPPGSSFVPPYLIAPSPAPVAAGAGAAAL